MILGFIAAICFLTGWTLLGVRVLTGANGKKKTRKDMKKHGKT